MLHVPLNSCDAWLGLSTHITSLENFPYSLIHVGEMTDIFYRIYEFFGAHMIKMFVYAFDQNQYLLMWNAHLPVVTLYVLAVKKYTMEKGVVFNNGCKDFIARRQLCDEIS